MSRPRTIPTISLLSLVLLSIGQPTFADDGVDFFEKKIRPVLVKHCYECHSASASEVKGKLRLDSRGAIRKGGETGPAVVPRDAGKSLLLDAIRHESLEMPPDKKLSAAIIADFQRWIKMGAPDPRDRPPTAHEAAALSWQITLETRRRWWSMQPVVAPNVPRVKNAGWSDRVIDRLILHKLEHAGLKPAPPADARTLIRRLSLVLTGLPPMPQDIDAFLVHYAEQPEAAYDGLIDRLLQSPNFGERWARHWMDVVRFTETHGNEWNYEVHHAWRYRDYLIRALNRDVPYNQLIREHIAGDLLPQPRWNEGKTFNESIIGTAFYRFGEVNHDDCIGLRKIGFDLADNRIDTLTKAFQATTVACARCHDHKMDAVSTKDYYALLGILRSARLVAHTIDAPDVNAAPMRTLGALKVEIRQELADRWLKDAGKIGRYLIAADAVHHKRATAAKLAGGLDPKRLEKWVAALKVEKPSLDHPLSPWLALENDVAATWNQQKDRYLSQHRERQKFNKEHFQTYADFRGGQFGDWKATGHGLRQRPTTSGDFCVAGEGEAAVSAILQAGSFTHTLSEKLNGTLRSPILRKGKKHISFQVLGGHTSALRLVSNNCQLNYKNYRALTSDTLQWVTFSLPEELESVRVYAELMTKFNNPKFPDQLGTLGGDTQNDRVPWEKAAADPRSHFGITRVVVHDCTETPKPGLDHLVRLFAGDQKSTPQTVFDVADLYSKVIEQAIRVWKENRATEADVRWLHWLVSGDLLDRSVNQTPKLAKLIAEYRTVEQKQLSLPRIVPGVGDFDNGFDQALLIRGDCMKPGEVVPRRYLEVLARPGETFTPSGSGRLELAAQIASPKNPLTARVMVNRIWHHLFGVGIVRTVDDFGHVGDLPSHAELLDHLAVRFVEEGWSIKKLIREIVRTRTFRMSSRVADAASEIDPQNRLLHHYPARRLEAEAIRDSILATSGRLDRTLFGRSILPYRAQAIVDRRLFPGPLDGRGRRSIYTKVTLMEGPKFLEAFNFPGSKVTQGRRDVTNVPTQALALLNDPFVIQQSTFWAKRLVARREDSIDSRIAYMYQKALGRPPTADEGEEFRKWVRELAKLHDVKGKDEEILANTLVWNDAAHVMFNLQEFIFIP